jgi:hypothetical protein
LPRLRRGAAFGFAFGEVGFCFAVEAVGFCLAFAEVGFFFTREDGFFLAVDMICVGSGRNAHARARDDAVYVTT